MSNYMKSVTTLKSVTTGRTDRRTDRQTDAGQSDPYVPLCFAGDTKMHGRVYKVNSKLLHQWLEHKIWILFILSAWNFCSLCNDMASSEMKY